MNGKQQTQFVGKLISYSLFRCYTMCYNENSNTFWVLIISRVTRLLFKIKILWRNRPDTILLQSENILITISLQSPLLSKFQNGFYGLFTLLKCRLNYLDLLGNLILNYSHLLSKLISPAFGLLVRTEIISYYSG